MKRGRGHSESNSSGQPGKRRSTRGNALLAAAGSSSSVQTTGATRTTDSRQASSKATGAVRLPGAAGTATKQKVPRAAISSDPDRSSRAKKAGVPPQQRGAVSSTATPRGTGAVLRKRGAALPAPAATAGSTPPSPSLAAVADTVSSSRRRGGGGRGKGKSVAESDDGDAAIKMLASLLSPVSAATREDTRSETPQQQQVRFFWGFVAPSPNLCALCGLVLELERCERAATYRYTCGSSC